MRFLLSRISSFNVYVAAVILFAGSAALIAQDGASEENTMPEQSEVLKDRPFASPRLKTILKNGVLRVGMHAEYPPFRIAQACDPSTSPCGETPPACEVNAGPELYPGIDVEVACDLTRHLGVRLEIKVGSIETLMAMIQNNEIDVAFGGISSTLERARYVQFASPYFITTPAALLSKNRLPNESQSVEFSRRKLRGIADLKRLERLVLGVVAGTTTEKLLRDDPTFSKHKIERFNRRSELIDAFEKNQIDAIIADAVFITALTLEKPGFLVDAIALTQAYREEHLSPIVAYGDAEYLFVINFFIKELRRTGRLDALERKYLESDAWVKKE